MTWQSYSEPLSATASLPFFVQIRSRADELYLERGQEAAHDLDDWLQAERKIDG